MQSTGDISAAAEPTESGGRPPSEHPLGPSANPVYRAGQVMGDYVGERPVYGLLFAFGLGLGAGWLLTRPSTFRYSTPESRYRTAYDPQNVY